MLLLHFKGLQDGWGFETVNSTFMTSLFQVFKLPRSASVEGKSEALIALVSP